MHEHEGVAAGSQVVGPVVRMPRLEPLLDHG
jgi:hypothetical protein